MIKWVNYAISRTLEYEDEINRSLSLADKIESYVKEHYKEDISRDTIAGGLAAILPSGSQVERTYVISIRL